MKRIISAIVRIQVLLDTERTDFEAVEIEQGAKDIVYRHMINPLTSRSAYTIEIVSDKETN